VGKPAGKRPLGISRHRWGYNIKMYFKEVGWRRIDWIGLAQDRDRWQAGLNAVMNIEVP